MEQDDRCEASQEPSEVGADFVASEAQIMRGEAALCVFVREWRLSLNPEELDLMVYAVLKHAQDSTGSETAEVYQSIAADVHRLIAEEAERHRHMQEAQTASTRARDTLGPREEP